MFKTEIRNIDLDNYTLQGDSLVYEVVIVSNQKDRYKTIIEPTGLRNITTTVIDYNHNQLNTGARLFATKEVKNYQKRDGEILESALIGFIEVPKTARMYYKDNQGVEIDGGSLYDALIQGKIRSVSVEFFPIEDEIATTKSGIKIFRVWELPRLSFLSVASGQGSSEITRIRSMDSENTTNSNQRNMYNVNDTFEKEVKITILEVMEGEMPTYKISIDNMEMEIAEDKLTEMLQTAEVEDPETPETETPAETESPERMDSMKGGKESKRMDEETKTAIDSLMVMIDELKAEIQTLKEQKPTDNNSEENQTDSDEGMNDEATRQLRSLCLENPDLVNKITDKEVQEKIQRSLKMVHKSVEPLIEETSDSVLSNKRNAEKNYSIDQLRDKYNPYNK